MVKAISFFLKKNHSNVKFLKNRIQNNCKKMKNYIPLVEQYYVQQKEHIDKKGTETEKFI